MVPKYCWVYQTFIKLKLKILIFPNISSIKFISEYDKFSEFPKNMETLIKFNLNNLMFKTNLTNINTFLRRFINIHYQEKHHTSRGFGGSSFTIGLVTNDILPLLVIIYVFSSFNPLKSGILNRIYFLKGPHNRLSPNYFAEFNRGKKSSGISTFVSVICIWVNADELYALAMIVLFSTSMDAFITKRLLKVNAVSRPRSSPVSTFKWYCNGTFRPMMDPTGSG